MKGLIKTFLVLLLVISVIRVGNVYAQRAFEIIVYPARQEVDVQPGETKHMAVSFLNKALYPTEGVLKKADFIVKGEDNIPYFIEGKSINNRYSAASWIKLPFKNITIAAQDKAIVYLDVKVPEDALPGGHYAAVFFEGEGSGKINKGSASSTIPRVGALFYFRVVGDVKENAEISKFSVPSFLEYGPITVNTAILNGGDIHIKPSVKIELYDMFGKKVDEVKLRERNIFPQTLSTYKNEIGERWMVGKYTLKLVGSYGTRGQGLKATTAIVVFPYRVAAVGILTLIIVIYLILHFYHLTQYREVTLEKELEEEKKELDELKKKLKNRPD